MIKVGLLIVAAVLVGGTVVCRPSWLSGNAFLLEFVNHEILALLAVILTVTLASVANIHLALNRLVLERFKGKAELISAAKNVKKEINDNAWYIFYGFVAVILILLLKGAFVDNIYVIALAHGVSIWVFLLNLVAMYDIYKVVYGIVELELDVGSAPKKGEDYTS